MPEGDILHKLAAALDPELRGHTLDAILVRHRRHAELTDRRVARVTSKGKHLYIELDDGHSIRNHLGLHGTWHRYRAGEPWHKPERQASLILRLPERVYVCFNAKEVEILATQGFHDRDQRQRLGPDLTRESPDAADLMRRARERLEPETLVVDLLLDQRIASGIGNVYKSEVLFLEACPPRARFGDLHPARFARLYQTAERLLVNNLGGGPRITREARDGRGPLWVYRRAGLACLRCGAPVAREMLGRNPRSTYWCPSCQSVDTTHWQPGSA